MNAYGNTGAMFTRSEHSARAILDAVQPGTATERRVAQRTAAGWAFTADASDSAPGPSSITYVVTDDGRCLPITYPRSLAALLRERAAALGEQAVPRTS